jgi:hypothetical protein
MTEAVQIRAAPTTQSPAPDALVDQIAAAVRPCLGDSRTLARTVLNVITRSHRLVPLKSEAVRAALLTLSDSGAKLKTQDAQCTADPIYIVYQKRRIYGIDPNYGGEVVWIDEEAREADPEEAARLEAGYESKGDDTEDTWTSTSYVDVDEFVTCCFTADAANAYIAANKHRLKHPHVYIDTLYRNTEMKAVRELLGALS